MSPARSDWMGQTVGNIAVRNLVSIEPTGLVSAALELADHNDIPYIIVRDDKLRGIACRICDLDAVPPNESIGSHMSTAIVTIDADASIQDAAKEMKLYEIGCLFVFTGDDLVGIVTRGDLVRAGLDQESVGSGFVCAACDSSRHVHTHGASDDVAFCEECWESSKGC